MRNCLQAVPIDCQSFQMCRIQMTTIRAETIQEMRSCSQNPTRFSLLGRAAFDELLTLIFLLANERLKSIFHIQALTLTTILANERLRSSYSYLRVWEKETLILVAYAGVRSNGWDRLPYPNPNPGPASGKNERLRWPQAIKNPEQWTAEIVFHITSPNHSALFAEMNGWDRFPH
jgi:hypothetical protein